MTLAEVIDDIKNSLDLSDDDLAALLASELSPRRWGIASLTDQESSFLAEYGGIEKADLTHRNSNMLVALTGLTSSLRTASDTASAAQVAQRLGVDASRIRHRVSERALYGYKVGRALRLPLWQFDDDGLPLPSLRSLLAALPGDLHPLEARGFMITPQADLDIDDHDVSPRDWLLAEGDVKAVVRLAEGIDDW